MSCELSIQSPQRDQGARRPITNNASFAKIPS